MGDMEQHPDPRGEYRPVANHPVPSVEAEIGGAVLAPHPGRVEEE